MNSLVVCRFIFFGIVVISFPLSCIFVHYFNYNKYLIANILSKTIYQIIYAFSLPLAMFSSFFPFSCLKHWNIYNRIESLVLSYVSMSYITHLTWELGYLLFHNYIIENNNSPLTFIWWAYIDGGDKRYAIKNSLVIVMEILSVLNGFIGSIALIFFIKQRNILSILIITGTSIVHLYSVSLYYLSEIIEGFPNVESSFISFYIKFFLANSPWIIVPWFVFWWCKESIYMVIKKTI